MLSKNNTNNNNKKAHRALALTILSLSVVSLIITISAPDYSSAQVSDSQNAATVGGIPSANSTGMNTTAASPTTMADVRTFVEQAHMALQNNDIQGALMNVESALSALEDVGGNGEQNINITATSPQNKVTADQTTTTEAGTVGSGGAGGAGTAGGIMTGSST